MAFVNGYLTAQILQKRRWVKDQVYSTNQRNLKELENRMVIVLTNIPRNILKSALGNVRFGLKKCAGNAGIYDEISSDVHKILANNLILFSLVH